MSRSEAKRVLDKDAFVASMAGKTWNSDRVDALIDEAPLSYKDIDQVMEDQKNLVRIVHTLSQVFNYKG
jgi:tRNA-splicing ligase RtcB